jgi:hypothetical protein
MGREHVISVWTEEIQQWQNGLFTWDLTPLHLQTDGSIG